VSEKMSEQAKFSKFQMGYSHSNLIKKIMVVPIWIWVHYKVNINISILLLLFAIKQINNYVYEVNRNSVLS